MTTYSDTISDSFGVQGVAIKKTNINPYPSTLISASMKGKVYKVPSPISTISTIKEFQDTGLSIGVALHLHTSPGFFKAQLVAITRTNTRSYSMKTEPGTMRYKPYKTPIVQSNYTTGEAAPSSDPGVIVLPPNIILQ